MELTQAEADSLIQMEKYRIDDQAWYYPIPGDRIEVPMQSPDGKERFLLDITRSQIDLKKVSHQTRYRKTAILVRLCLGSAPHRNPDGQEIPAPHIHLYREGFGDTWAFPVEPRFFSNLADLNQALVDFMGYCNITRPPVIVPRLL